MAQPAVHPNDLASFTSHLTRSTRILALLGAGLSASSGLPTFRGAGGLWRTHDAPSLATPSAFYRDPSLVWQFYSYRRHMALNALPNRAHKALAALARIKGAQGFMTLSQNVDGLSPRAGHPAEALQLLHGSLYDVKCWDEQGCGYVKRDDFTDPIVPALAIPSEADGQVLAGIQQRADTQARANLEAAAGRKHAIISGQESEEGATSSSTAQEVQGQESSQHKHKLIRGADISSISVPLPTIPLSSLPQCPRCQRNLLRPGVVWFDEELPEDVMAKVDAWISRPERIDLMLVIGTSSVVYPAAAYTQFARARGARVAVINIDANDARDLRPQDWFFQGDAAVIVPEILRAVIGEVE